MNRMSGAAAAVTDAVHAARDVLFSRGCAGCGAPDEVLCATCMRGLAQPVRFDLPATVCGVGMACGSYRGPLRRAVLAWKDHGDAECDGPFSDAMAALLHSEPLYGALAHVKAVGIVSAPSSWLSICTRGRSQLDSIADALAVQLRAWGVDARVYRALQVRRVRTKSVQTSSAQGRRERVAGHIRCRNSMRLPAGMPVIVIDDIVTSGATMRECIDVLRARGNTVLTGLALAHTPPRAPDRS